MTIPEVKVITFGSFKDPLLFYKLTFFNVCFLHLCNGGMNIFCMFISYDGFIHLSGVVVDGRPFLLPWQ